MLNKITLALAAALVLGTTPYAFSAAKHHAKAPVHATVSSAAYRANALAGTNGGSVGGETYMRIQDRDYVEQNGVPYCGGRC